jgi:hypothetical protein
MEYVEGDDMEEMDDIEYMEDFGSLSDGKDDLLKLPMWFPVYLEYFILNFFFWPASVPATRNFIFAYK